MAWRTEGAQAMLNVELSSAPASANSALYSSHRMPNRVGKTLLEADNVKLLKEEEDPQNGKKLSSRYRGVCWNKKNRRWQAAINSSGKYLYLGSYVSEEEAARAFDRAAVRIRGKKARINFRFEDYADEDLESWHTDLHSKDPKDSRTKASKTPLTRKHPPTTGMSNLSAPGVSVLSGVPHGQNFGFSGAVFSGPAKTVGLERGYHDTRVVGSSSTFLSKVPERQGSGLVFGDSGGQAVQGVSEPLWGQVLEVAQQEGSALQGQVVLAAAAKNEETGAGNLYASNDQSAGGQACLSLNLDQVDLTAQQPVLVLPNSPQPNQPLAGAGGGEASTPSGGFGSSFSAGGPSGQGTGDPQLPPGDGSDHTPLPPDCQILKIIPCNWGVFGVMYVRPGHEGIGAAVWDGRAIHDMGLFSSKRDAKQACTGGTDIVVRLHNGSGKQILSQGSEGPMILTALPGNGMLTPATTEVHGKDQVQLGGVTVPGNGPPGAHISVSGRRESLERSSGIAGLNSSQQNLLKLLSISSEDLSKYLGQLPASGPEGALSGVTSDHNRSISAIAELVKQDNGNLGSLLHWDSWNSSILSLLSKHGTSPGRGTSGDHIKQDCEEKETGPNGKPTNSGSMEVDVPPAAAPDGESAAVGTIGTFMPSWLRDLGSLAELGSIQFQESGNLSWLVRQNDDCVLLQQQGSGFGSEVGEAGPPEAQRNETSTVEVAKSAAPGPGSMDQHKEDNPLTSMWRHNASSDYDEVVKWFVSHPQREDNKGKLKPESAVVKTEDGGPAPSEPWERSSRAAEQAGTKASVVGGERAGTPVTEGMVLHGGIKRKGLEGCEELITTKRPRSPC